MVLAVLTGSQVDKDDDGIVSVHEAQSAIREQSPVMAAAFAPQGRVYVDAVESALGERPRLELWFLQLGVIWRAELT